ncbi:MAG: pantothenate kinase [Elainellaceae cyanobacterium]
MADAWLGLLIGNTRLHWARFEQDTLVEQWEQPHLTQANSADAIATVPPAHRPLATAGRLWLASVAPQQTRPWRPYCQPPITLDQVPLQSTYSTLGVDRALALWGAGQRWGFPALVIDGGTALTYTGADAAQVLVGGAILPGLRLQMRSLYQGTGLLPYVELGLTHPMDRWATTTTGAIASGILHSAIAGVESFLADWWQRFPNSAVVFTGGDGELLQACLPRHRQGRTHYDPHLGFWGLQQVRRTLIGDG